MSTSHNKERSRWAGSTQARASRTSLFLLVRMPPVSRVHCRHCHANRLLAVLCSGTEDRGVLSVKGIGTVFFPGTRKWRLYE